MARVVAIGDQAWALDLLREEGRVEADGLILTWEAGQNSALDTRKISQGRDIGNVLVQRQGIRLLTAGRCGLRMGRGLCLLPTVPGLLLRVNFG